MFLFKKKKNILEQYEIVKKKMLDLGKLVNNQIKYRLTRLMVNLKDLFKKDMSSKNGFIINTSINYDLTDYDKTIMSDGIMSYKFGVKDKDPTIVQEIKFTCECGFIKSPIQGITCDICSTKTSERVYTRGWMELPKDVYILNPDFLNLVRLNLTKATGKRNKRPTKALINNVLKGLLKGNNTTIYKDQFILVQLAKPENKGLLKDFINEFVEPSMAKKLIKNFGSLTTNKIPIMSKDLRNYSVRGGKIGEVKIDSHPLNGIYIDISKSIDTLKHNHSFDDVDTNKILLSIQNKLDECYTIVMKAVGDGKNSEIREFFGGKRKSNSGRLVLEAHPLPIANSCMMSYIIFGKISVDLYREIYLIFGLTPIAEFRMKSFIPNKQDKVLMNKVLNHLKDINANYIKGVRPPAIYSTSSLGFEIIALINDNVFRIDEISFNAIHGDKDGDNISLFMLSIVIAMVVGWSLHYSRLMYDPFRGEARSELQHVESNYFNNYLMFNSENKQDTIKIINKK